MTYHSIKAQQNSFFQNQARPSAVLTTDLNLDRDQAQALRDRWNEQSKGLHAGGVPILTSGLKVQPWTAPAAAKDMQVAELLKMSVEQVALVFRARKLKKAGRRIVRYGSNKILIRSSARTPLTCWWS
jgi:phage portal protein BeeE